MIDKLTRVSLLIALAAPGVFAWAEDPVRLHHAPEAFLYAAGHSYLGVEIQEVTADRVSALKLKEERGVEITMVDQDAPAGKAGLREHDVILEFNEVKVEGGEQLRRLIRETPPGRAVVLGISREGAPMSLTIQLGDRGKVEASNMEKLNHERFAPPRLPEFPAIDIPEFDFHVFEPDTPVLGLQAESLGPQLRAYFGVKSDEGLLVKSVEKGSLADKAGIKAGDVITAVDNEKVSGLSSLRRILRSHPSGGRIVLGIVRDRHEQSVTIVAPEGKPRDSSAITIHLLDIQAALERARPQIEKAMQLGGLIPTLRGCSAWRWTYRHNFWSSSANGLGWD